MTIKQRIQFIDIAKGIAIFLVVWGHTVTNEEQLGPHCPMLVKILYSFHMPLFFFLSGMSMSLTCAAPAGPEPVERKTLSIRTWIQWRAFLKKNILTIAFPYFIWALIYCAFSYNNLAWVIYGSWESLGKVSSLTSLWFLPALFVGKVVTQAVVSYTLNRTWLPLAIMMFVVALFIPHPSIGYPWCFDVGVEAAAFILLGMVCRLQLVELQVQKLSVLAVLFVISVALFVLALKFENNIVYMSMCRNQYNMNVFVLIRMLSGSFAVIILAMILRQLVEEKASDHGVRSLIYLGQYTIGIFILHKPFLQQIVLPTMNSLTGNVLDIEVIRFFSALIAMLATLPVCNIIIHYVPELIGIFSKDKLMLSNHDHCAQHSLHLQQ